MRVTKKQLVFGVGAVGFFLVLLTVMANVCVALNAKDKMFDSAAQLPDKRVGLLLGTSKYLHGGSVNLYYKYRVDAAVDAYEQGKVSAILVSGDNGHRSYNEPVTLQKSLMERGIPASAIVLDYAGFRTLDSVVRAKKVFGQGKILIISQKFHNARAIYLAEHYGIDALALNAQTVSARWGWRVMLREYFARVKVFLDIALGVQPKFLGEPVPIKAQ